MKTSSEAPKRDTARLAADVVQDAQGFAALEGEWADLHEACPSATPFQSWAWLYSWWENYGDPYELRLVTVRRDWTGGELVGLVPLMLERRGLGRLLFVGQALTDHLDMLAREGWEDAVARTAARTLEQMGGWRVADLQELRPGAMAWALESRWPGPRTSLWQSNCLLTEVRPWDDLLMSLTRKRRSSARQAIRRAEADGVRPVLAGAVEAEDAAGRLVALHRESWRGRGIGLEHTTGRFEALMKSAVRRLTACGLGAVSEFRRDGEVVISHFLIFGRDFVGGYMLGANEEALKRYQVSSLCVWDAANVARGRNLRYINELRGEESYKIRWSSETVANHRLILGRNATLVVAYARWQLLRSKTHAYAGSEEAPRWIKAALTGYRGLRSRLARCSERGSG